MTARDGLISVSVISVFLIFVIGFVLYRASTRQSQKMPKWMSFTLLFSVLLLGGMLGLLYHYVEEVKKEQHEGYCGAKYSFMNWI